MKVSVIIPFYRVASFIERCARSLMEQSLAEVEFLFVDDASPDESRQILEDVLAAYPARVARILTHPVNRGLPAARNTGLDAARGEYIFHCDSDDWVEPQLLERLYQRAQAADADIAYCDFYMSFERSERYMGNPDFTNGEDLLTRGFLAGTCKYNVWNKLIRRDLYERSRLRFPEGHGMGEDMTVILLTARAGRVVHCPEALYHYVKLNSGAFSNTFSERHLTDIRFNADRTFAGLAEVDFPEREQFLAFFKLNLKLPFLLSGDRPQYRLYREWYPEADAYALKNPYLPLRTRVLQWCAAKGWFWAVSLYGWLVNRVYYGLRFR